MRVRVTIKRRVGIIIDVRDMVLVMVMVKGRVRVRVRVRVRGVDCRFRCFDLEFGW